MEQYLTLYLHTFSAISISTAFVCDDYSLHEHFYSMNYSYSIKFTTEISLMYIFIYAETLVF